ncbi:MAG: YceI family protein [Desulfococcaceae bacterium]
MVKNPAIFTIILTAILLAALPAGAAEEQLLVFVQPEASKVAKDFRENRLPEIRNLATDMDVSVEVIEVGEGPVPPEVGITPLLVFQNHRGRSIYQGRTTTPARIRNFIRTSRFVPQGEEKLAREDIPIWTTGRAQVWAPIKVAPVTGAPPEGYDHEAFVREARAAMEKGFDQFETRDRVELGRADRGFYMDFYPWRADDGTLFLSLALYSQFHCKAPVFEMKKEPLVGPYSEREKLFRQAAEIMEKAVARQIADTEDGDGFDPVAKETPAIAWAETGYPLPPKPERAAMADVDAEIPLKWTLAEPGPDDPPMVQFRFPAPLDQYTGEVKQGNGQFRLAEGKTLNGANGFVEMDPTTVTMGVEDLDEVLQGSLFLDTDDHPAARFEVESVSSDGRPVEYGQLSPAAVSGSLLLKGTKKPMQVAMEMEPVIGEEGKPRLLARGRFQIDLTEFDIEGADGPEPARNTLVFDLNLAFRPAEDAIGRR